MKIILSRKGFDSTSSKGPYGTNKSCASPIMPDGALLSIPIPTDDADAYIDFEYNGISYSDLLMQLSPKSTYSNCHLDPDIRKNIRKKEIDNWQPAFGQCERAQGYLRNQNVGEGDLFLFFGLFQQVVKDKNGYRFTKSKDYVDDFYKRCSLNIIYGYMQVEKVITDQKEIEKYHWHPHSKNGYTNNALYIPKKYLSFAKNKPGYGVFNFDEKRVLTMKGKSPATWKIKSFYMPENLLGTSRKNSARKGGLYYQGQWQEIVLKSSKEAKEWVKNVILD